MADLTVQDFSDEDGGTVTFAAADAAGDKFVYDSRAAILIKNDDAASKTVTITPAYSTINDPTHGELTRSPIILAVAAGAVGVIPPVPDSFSNRADARKVALTYDAVTSLSIAVLRTK